MAAPPVLISEKDGILDVVLNRPEKYNAISDEMLGILANAFTHFADQKSLRVMLLRGVGKYFCAGVEITEEISPDVGGSTLDGRHWYRKKYHSVFDQLELVEKPVVVAHQGDCLGGGLEISLSCDFRIAARGARYSLPEINIGVLPGSGGVSRLTRLAGPHWARWLVMAGESIDADQALSAGLLHAVLNPEDLEGYVWSFCRRLALRPYELLGLAKLSIELSADLDRAQARNVERIANSILFTGAEHKALVRAFVENREQRRKARTKGSDRDD
jgi:enoyl-CoA hydratase/carnithine racemase